LNDPSTQEGPSPGPLPPDQARALKLFVVLSRAAGAVLARSREDVARHALTEGEFSVLEALYSKGPLLLGDVKRKILASGAGVTYLVDRLEARGLLTREPCPSDRRARFAVLTEEGRRLLDGIFPIHAKVLEEALGALEPEEQEAATRLLRKLGRAVADLPRLEPLDP
jgi:MarR family 2-MHQ and catechol resistance regulon transcriptional repressor